MEIYLIVALAVIFLNILPAFSPPTWLALIFFKLNYDLNSVALILIGVASATIGRGFLAWYFRKFSHLIPARFLKNMEFAGEYLGSRPQRRYAVMILFLISPVSSTQLFEAAGMMKTVSLKPLLALFALGRTFSYSFYVFGAAAIAATNFGEIVTAEIKSPWAIGVQLLMIAGLIALGLIDWKKKLNRHP